MRSQLRASMNAQAMNMSSMRCGSAPRTMVISFPAYGLGRCRLNASVGIRALLFRSVHHSLLQKGL